jgi:hypothetical protein
MTYNNTVTVDRLRDLMHYDPETGVFTNRVKRAANAMPGRVSGGGAMGYWHISVDGMRYKAHRLAWLYVYGSWPEAGLDHINGDPLDNRIANLRVATQRDNMKNAARPLGRSGLRGVTPHGRRWRAAVTKNGRRVIVGSFETPEEAHEAYKAAAAEVYGSFAYVESRK